MILKTELEKQGKDQQINAGGWAGEERPLS
jgi:hypothetical protein